MTRFRPSLTLLEARDNPATAFTTSGAIPGGAPLVEVVGPAGNVLTQFQAFETGFTGGVRADTGELDGDPTTVEVAVSAGPGGGPRIRVFAVRTDSGITSLLGEFFAFESTFRGGVRVAVGDVDGSGTGFDQIIVGTDDGGGPRVAAFRFDGLVPTPLTTPLGNFFAFESTFRGGVRVAAGELDGNTANGDELAVAAGPGGAPRVRVLRGDGTVVSDTFAFPPTLTSGLNVGFVFGTGTLLFDMQVNDFSQRSDRLNAPILAALAAQGASGFNVGTTGFNFGAGSGTDGFSIGQNGGTTFNPVTGAFGTTQTSNLGAFGTTQTSNLGAFGTTQTSNLGAFGTTQTSNTGAFGTGAAAPQSVNPGTGANAGQSVNTGNSLTF